MASVSDQFAHASLHGNVFLPFCERNSIARPNINKTITLLEDAIFCAVGESNDKTNSSCKDRGATLKVGGLTSD